MTPRDLGEQREICAGSTSSGGIAIRPASGSGDARTAAAPSAAAAAA